MDDDDATAFGGTLALATIVAELIAALERSGALSPESIHRILDDAVFRNASSADRKNAAVIMANLVNAVRARPIAR